MSDLPTEITAEEALKSRKEMFRRRAEDRRRINSRSDMPRQSPPRKGCGCGGRKKTNITTVNQIKQTDIIEGEIK